VVLTNIVKLKLLTLMRIYLVVNFTISRVIRYKKLVKRQKVEKPNLVKVDREEEQKVENFFNKRMV